jgi:hypothetical protein
MNVGRLVAVLLCALAVPACGRMGSSSARAGDDPHDTDSLYVLYRRILADSDPVTIWSETTCEMSRLMDRIGEKEAGRRIRALTDTVYTAAERRRRAEIETRLAYHAYPLDDASCAKDYDFEYAPDSTNPATRPQRAPPR